EAVDLAAELAGHADLDAAEPGRVERDAPGEGLHVLLVGLLREAEVLLVARPVVHAQVDLQPLVEEAAADLDPDGRATAVAADQGRRHAEAVRRLPDAVLDADVAVEAAGEDADLVAAAGADPARRPLEEREAH